jgi:hypothetical protein
LVEISRLSKALVVVLAITSGLCGCSTTKMKVAKNAPKLAAYSGPVCLLKSPLPSEYTYITLGRIASGKHFYGSLEGVLAAVADKARSAGANAVIKLRAYHTVDAVAWSVPKAVGIAVKIDVQNLDCKAMGGDNY